MVAHSTEISVPARLTELPCLLAAVDAWAAIVGIPPIAVQRIHFAVEELFTNTVDHGFRAESDLPVTLALAADGGGITLRYVDRAPPFDTSRVPDLAPEAEHIGGYGLKVVQTMASAFRYRFANGANETEIEFR